MLLVFEPFTIVALSCRPGHLAFAADPAAIELSLVHRTFGSGELSIALVFVEKEATFVSVASVVLFFSEPVLVVFVPVADVAVAFQLDEDSSTVGFALAQRSLVTTQYLVDVSVAAYHATQKVRLVV